MAQDEGVGTGEEEKRGGEGRAEKSERDAQPRRLNAMRCSHVPLAQRASPDS